MSRTVTALFASRGEAEAARASLATGVKVESTRLLAKETAGALDDLAINPKQVKVYRDALLSGNHLLVAKVGRGEMPANIVSALKRAAAVEPPSEESKLTFGMPDAEVEAAANDVAPPPVAAKPTAVEADPAAVSTEHASTPPEAAAPIAEAAQPPPANREPAPAATPDSEMETPEPSVAEDREELRIGEQRAARGGAPDDSARVTRLEVENREPARRLTPEEVEAGGLLKERVIEVVEMREEPVIAKDVVVREEVIVRKTVDERTETIQDSVRRTDVKVEELR